MSWLKKLVGGGKKKPKRTDAEIAAAQQKAREERKFGELTVRFNPNIKECDKAGVKFILNEDTKPIPFETPFFVGRMVVRVKNAKDAPVTTYWKGKARKFSIQVQGRFKKRLCTEHVRLGSTFARPIIIPWGGSIALKILGSIDPSLRHNFFKSNTPSVSSPLICAVEQCSIRKPTGDESTGGLGPWTFGGEERVNEDSHLFLPEKIRATTPKMGFKKRCHYFANEKIRKRTFWEPDLVYNFDFLSSRVDFNKFNVVVGPFKKSMATYMNKQAFDFRATVWDEETNSKVIGHIFGIEFILDSLYDGEVPTAKDIQSSPADEPALLDLDVANAAAEYEQDLDLSPTAVSAKGAAAVPQLDLSPTSAAAAASDAAPALPEASASASAAAASASDSAAAAPSE